MSWPSDSNNVTGWDFTLEKRDARCGRRILKSCEDRWRDQLGCERRGYVIARSGRMVGKDSSCWARVGVREGTRGVMRAGDGGRERSRTGRVERRMWAWGCHVSERRRGSAKSGFGAVVKGDCGEDTGAQNVKSW